ncbi:hypothetical protein G7Y89_g10193 [Cudoniella acicularis]|uniref:Uncharacterized protein n=1 Tax=Cudoniella acicularis TaxID=354080 RepID=A0A8H4REU0_9HELO|nr:hypothetical protein G7Y89_g10193 [Cudoniella acicularis]
MRGLLLFFCFGLANAWPHEQHEDSDKDVKCDKDCEKTTVPCRSSTKVIVTPTTTPCTKTTLPITSTTCGGGGTVTWSCPTCPAGPSPIIVTITTTTTVSVALTTCPTSPTTVITATTCVTGTPSTLSVTSPYSPTTYVVYGAVVTPTQTPPPTNPIPNPTWASQYSIGHTSVWNAPSPTNGAAYAQPIKQLLVLHPILANNHPRPDHLPLNNRNRQQHHARTRQHLCLEHPLLTLRPLRLRSPRHPQPLNFAEVTPTAPLPSSGTLSGYTVETGFSQAYLMGQQDIVIENDQKDDALVRCGSYCREECTSWFVGWFLKGAGGYFWRCFWFSELLTPAQFIPENFSDLVNSTGWNDICAP